MLFEEGLIIGGGLDGMMLSHCLRSQGIENRIFEERPALAVAEDSAIIIWPPVFKAVENYIRPDLIQEHAMLLNGINYFRYDGRPISNAKFAPSKTAYAIGRNDFAGLLSEGCEIYYDKRFERYGDTPEQVKAYFTDGTASNGRFLIGCDGMLSRVRKQIQRESELIYRGFNQWMGILEDPGFELTGNAINIYTGLGIHFGMLPLMQGKIGWWAQIKDSDENEIKETERAESIFDSIGHWADPIPYIIQKTTSIACIKGFDRPVTKGWSWGNGGLIGHAAHPLLPFMNFGLNTSVSESIALSQLLATCENPSEAFISLENSHFKRAGVIRSEITRKIARLMATGITGAFKRDLELKFKAFFSRI
jgi:2-polyprenyl-6-methoxyphenol hydroxylase-like FAD-dependent oxidoreductase